MVTITLHCPYCQSNALVRNAHAPNGKPLYRCHSCGRQSRENPTPHASSEARREEILHAYQPRSRLRGLTRTDCASRARPCLVGSQKSSATSAFVYNSADRGSRRFHFHHTRTGRTDGSFVFKKAHDVWMRDCLVPQEAAGGR